MKPWSWLPLGLLTGLFAVFVAIGLYGIDFGYAWDEPLLILQVRDSIENKLLLPTGESNAYWPSLKGGDYEYPMLLYWVGIGSALPEIIERGPVPTGPADVLTNDFRLQMRLRRICLLIDSLTLVWVYLAAASVNRRWGIALFAAGLVAASWEFAYHCRFIATDALMTQFGGATLMCCMAGIRAPDPLRRQRRLIAGAVLAGLGMATKYPGGMLAIPVLAAGWLSVPSDPWWPRIKRVAKLFALQIAVFALVDPGMFLQPWNFFAWVWFDHIHYGVLGHGVHTIHNHVAHLSAIAQWIWLTMFSPSAVVSAAMCCLCGIGAIRLLWTDRRAAAVLLLFPVVYLGYFATQVAEIVRNLLVVVPFLTVIAAMGAATLFDAAGRFRGRAKTIGPIGVVVMLSSVVMFSLVWQCVNVVAINTRHWPDNQADEGKKYIAAHPELSFYPTELAANLMDLPLLPPSPAGKPVVVAYATDDNGVLFPANVHHFARAVFGAPEVNFDDYPDWLSEHLVVLDLDAARRTPSPVIDRAIGRHDRSITAPAGYKLGPLLSAGGPNQIVEDGVTISCVNPTAALMPITPAASSPGASQRWVNPSAVRFDISGLKPGRGYIVGWSWWDVEQGNRQESAWIESPADGVQVQLIGPTSPPPWTADRPSRHWPPPEDAVPPACPTAAIPAGSCVSGRCRFIVRRESGPDVGVSSVWVYCSSGSPVARAPSP